MRDERRIRLATQGRLDRWGRRVTFYQGDTRWDLVLGHGPARIPLCGCVLCALTEAANRLAGRSLNPATANMLLQRVPGAFVGPDGVSPGDEIVVPLAAPHLGLAVGPLVQGDDIRSPLIDALGNGGMALVRVAVTGARENEHHTILAHQLAGPFIECTDSAWPAQGGVTNGYSILDNRLGADLLWARSPRHYQAIAVRGLRRLAQ